METRATTDQEKEVMEYLNELRDSGVTNMFGSFSYVIKEFNVDKKTASSLVSLWMANFNSDGIYDTVKIKNK